MKSDAQGYLRVLYVGFRGKFLLSRSLAKTCENRPNLLFRKNSFRFRFWIFQILYMMVEEQDYSKALAI